MFVYGSDGDLEPSKYLARQTLRASQEVARFLNLNEDQIIFIRQNPTVIDAGVFHNDVISVGNQNVFLYYEKAFAEADSVQKIDEAYAKLNSNQKLVLIEIKEAELTVEDAVKTYFFNSQIVTLPNGCMVIIAPQHVHDLPSAKALMQKIIDDTTNPIESVHYMDLTQSMQNGGGPACLRLRVVMNEEEIDAVKRNANVFLTDELVDDIRKWINKFYREELTLADLADIQLYDETAAALKELSELMRFPLLQNNVKRKL